MTKHLNSIVRSILKSSGDEVSEAEFYARRMGRNQVWRIDPADQTPVLYAKFWSNPIDFRRELSGLKISAELASQSKAFTAAEVVLASEEHGVVVTKSLRGKSFDKILKRAYRIDQNPLTRSRSLRLADQCMEMILEWLKRLHQLPVHSSADLLDHSVLGVKRRIHERIGFIEKMKIPENDQYRLKKSLELAQKYCVQEQQNATALQSYVFADVCPVNFIYDGNQLGVIDFEDFGIGPPNRDQFVFDYHLQRVESHWHYHSCARLREKLAIHASETAIYEIEFGLVEVVNTAIEIGRPSGTRSLRKAIDQLERIVMRCTHRRDQKDRSTQELVSSTEM